MVTGKYQNRYWENFYKKDNLTTNPSDFCKYVCENYDLKDKNVLEACSGNGRDSYYLSNFCKQITAVDQAIKIKETTENIKSFKEDLSVFLKNKNCKFDIMYCRFGIHSITENVEDILLKNSKEIYFEFRSDKDNSYKKDHYRRKINGNDFITKLINLGFEICYFKESKNLAIFEAQNPIIIRVIAKRKKN
jgi:hypothetical protein